MVDLLFALIVLEVNKKAFSRMPFHKNSTRSISNEKT